MTSISVAMATFNGAKYIHAQLASLIEQELPPTEIVICDDGSTDGTVECIQAIAEQQPGLIRVYQNPHRLGFVGNFERAISLCSGEWIFLCDQDDLWHATKLAAMMAALQAKPASVLAVANAELVDSELRPFHKLLYTSHHLQLLAGESTNRSVLRGLFVNGCTLGFRARFRPFILPIGSQVWGHDHWIATMLCLVAPVATVAEPQMLYRRHTNSSGSNPRLERNPFKRAYRKLAAKLQHVSVEAYEADVKQWRELGKRLAAMEQSADLVIDRDRLAEAIQIVARWQRFAERRWQLRQQNQLMRLPQIGYFLASGRYHQTSNGFGAFLKDLIV